ncbi:MAG: VOC family protein [Phenylobacterium zucineum]|nr:MAG: VOC family protein [Phenylobacterium zucineum]
MAAEPASGEAAWAYPYGQARRYHLQHTHFFASDLAVTLAFYTRWFDAEVVWDGDVAGARNVFMRIGIGALHFYEQPPRGLGRNAMHHLGMQVVGIRELYDRMKAAGLHIPNPIRELSGGGGYFMLGGPDDVVIEVFEPGPGRDPVVRDYYGLPG